MVSGNCKVMLTKFYDRIKTMEKYNLAQSAFVGDSVWELFVREIAIDKFQKQKNLHDYKINLVNAQAQADLLIKIEHLLNEEEKEIVRRGRNLKMSISKKHNPQIHAQATAFETIIGYLHLNNKEKLKEIFEFLKMDL